MEAYNIEYRIEEFIRTQFSVSPTDPRFDRGVDLFEAGYIDSMGIVELSRNLGLRLEPLRMAQGTSFPQSSDSGLQGG
jgi:hypothetical protein